MSLWSKLVQLDVKMRQAMAVYLIIPLFGLAIPVSLFVLGQSYVAYRSLADRGVQAIATIQTVAETGGRHNRNAVTSTFRAADGRDYTSKAFYALDGSRHLRPGMRMGVVYQHDLPSNNAPSLDYAKGELRSDRLLRAPRVRDVLRARLDLSRRVRGHAGPRAARGIRLSGGY